MFRTTLLFSTSIDICGYNGLFNSFDNCQCTISLRVNGYLDVQRLTRQLILMTVTVVSLESLLFTGWFLGSSTKGTEIFWQVIVLRHNKWGILMIIVHIGRLRFVCYWHFSQYQDSYHSGTNVYNSRLKKMIPPW